MKAGWFRGLSLVLVFLMSTPLPPAQAAKPKAKTKAKEKKPAVEQPVSTWPAAELTVGIQARDSETEGIGDLLVPVWNPGGTGLLFVNPRTTFTDHDAEEANLGIGYRQLLPKQHVILGANAYYDYRDTGYSRYDQWGFGLELLSPWIDARGNVYDPESKQTLVASETQTSVSQSSRTDAEWIDPYAEEHAVLQDYVVTRTVTTVTTTKTFEQFEQALGGYDWEIGLRLPLQCQALEARVFGGYYDFDRDYGDDPKGWKARAEIRLRSTLFLDAGLYENDELTGSDWFAGARFAVPLDLAKISQGRNPFATAKARLRGEPRDFSARLTEMVMRDPQIRLETSKFIENPALETENVEKDKDTDSTTYVLLSDVQFVDGDATGSGNGTGQNPFATIQQGADAVFGSRIVYVYDASRPYVENVQLLPGTTLWGSSILLPGYDSRVFGSGKSPIVDGASMGPAITVANRTTVQGFQVRNTDLGGGPLIVDLPVAGPTDVSRVGILGNGATDLLITRNTLSDGGTGALFARQGDFNLLFTDNFVRDNAGGGLEIWGAGNSGTFNATITRSLFADNGTFGAFIAADNYDEAFIDVSHSGFNGNGLSGLNVLQMNSGLASAQIDDTTATGNGASGFAINQFANALSQASFSDVASSGNAGNGLSIAQIDSMLALAAVGAVNASGNGLAGIAVEQDGNLLSLANVSGSVADGNAGLGIGLMQNSLLGSVGLIGLADGVDDTVNALAEGIGFPLPPELAKFFEPNGPVSASRNGDSGIEAQILAGAIGLGGFFDVTANDNLDYGVQAAITSPGIAVGLGGSSANWSEMFELGEQVGDLFGLDLPLAIAGNGQMQANDNLAGGFELQSVGGVAAVNAVVGVETIHNGLWGTVVGSLGDDLALNAVARIDTRDNGLGGLAAIAEGGDLAAVNVLADVNAVDNAGGDGIYASTISANGAAILLALSTDALRPIVPFLGETFLGAPVTLPGDPFGPVVANGNAGHGFQAIVEGNDLAAALLLDVQANGNVLDGIHLTVDSAAGLSLAGILASDLLYDELPGLFGAPAIPNAGLGPILAQNNGGNGIVLNQTGLDGAYAALVSIEANGNLGGDGIHVEQTATAGDAFALLLETDAANNSDEGIELVMNASGATMSALSFVDVASNANIGVRVFQTSTAGDSMALLGGVDALYNGGAGIVYNLTAANIAAAAITESESMFNGGRGVNMTLAAGGDVALLVGTNALPLLLGSGYVGGPVGAALGMLADQIPQDEPEFNDNGAAGFHTELTSTGGDVLFDIDGAMANDNDIHGFNIEVNAPAGDIIGSLNNVVASDNDNNGIFLTLNGGGGTLGLALRNLRTLSNDGNGINVVENYNGAVGISGERIVSANNLGNGVRLAMSGLTVPVMDFGNGGLGSLGLNSFYGNGNRDFRYNNGGGVTVMAENNWWGTPAPVAGQFAGSIDYTPAHPGPDPNAP